MRYRCYQNDWQHFVGNIIATVHVRSHGSPNVQGRGHFCKHTLKAYHQSINIFILTYLSEITCDFTEWCETWRNNLICTNITLSSLHIFKFPITPLGIFSTYFLLLLLMHSLLLISQDFLFLRVLLKLHDVLIILLFVNIFFCKLLSKENYETRFDSFYK